MGLESKAKRGKASRPSRNLEGKGSDGKVRIKRLARAWICVGDKVLIKRLA